MAKAKTTKSTKNGVKKPMKKATKAKISKLKKTPKKSVKPAKSVKKSQATPKNIQKKASKKTALEEKLERKIKANEQEHPNGPSVHTKSRTGKEMLPSILTSASFIEMTKVMDASEKKLGVKRTNLTVGGHIENAIATGVLMYDFVMGGGYAPGRFTVAPGAESSGKTTSIVTSLAQAVSQDVPVYVADAEASFEAGYADRALARFGYNMKQMQGEYDSKNNKWISLPMVRIVQENNGEKVFRLFKRIMMAMPVIKRDYDGNYWAVTTDEKSKKESAIEYSGLPQMMFFIDSLAALIPNILDGDDEKETIGAQARMFSMMLPKIAALMTSRNCIVVGTNQLRDKIGGFSMPGMPKPTTQPGGQAVKFYTDIRTQINACASSTAGWFKSTKSYYEETGIYGGVDRYVFTSFKNQKNKAFIPKREGYARIRFMRDGGPGDGYCETFDALSFLEATGQLSRRANTLSLDIQGVSRKKDAPTKLPIDPHAGKLSFMDFKRAVEDPKNRHSIWNHCRAQIKSGYAFSLERERVTNHKTVASEPEEE